MKKQEKLIKWFRKTDLSKNKGLYVLLIPSVLFVILFCYIPMVGIVLAFKEFDPVVGILNSKWLGIENFKFFFMGSSWLQITLNTLYLNVLFIISGTIASVILAIMLSELRKSPYLKAMQTFMTLPYFIGWTSIALFAVAFISPEGIITNLSKLFGGAGISFSTDPSVWPATFVIIRIWKTTGWSAIVFMASILGIDETIYESARIDGANRITCIFRITLPLIKNIIILMTILSIGSIFRGDLGMIYPFIGDNALLYPTTDIIDSYIFRALRTNSDFGKTTAIGLYQSVMGFILVLISNFAAKRYSPESAIF